jgi:hypothetical protein
MTENGSPKWVKKFVEWLFRYRYSVCLITGIAIIGFWFLLYFFRHWTAKDAAQICTGFFIVITLFFAALNYEFAASKMERDYKSARDLLTYNTATEWHKSPLKDYQIFVIKFEDEFIATSTTTRTPAMFETFIETRYEYKEALKCLLNHFETVSIGAYKGLIDKDFINEFYRGILKAYYVDYYTYIDNHRAKKNNYKIFENFTKLVEEWHPGIKAELAKTPLKSILFT